MTLADVVQMDLLHLSITVEDEEGGVCVLFFIPGKLESLVGREKEEAWAEGGAGQKRGTEVEE